MSSPPPARLPWRPIALLTAGLVVVLALAARLVLFGPPILELGDLAVNALQIEQAKHGREWYGNYSRFHFHHPGPAFFYVYAGGEALLHDLLGVARSPLQAHLLTGIALQSLFAAIALVVVADRLRSPLALPLVALVAAVHFGWAGDVFVSIWPPYVLAMPFLCFLVTGVSAVTGRPRHGLIALVAGGFLVHGHVAQALFVGGLIVVWLGLGGWRWRREGRVASLLPSRAGAWLAAGLLALFALPLVLDVLRYGLVGNTATIVRRFITNTGDAKSLLQAVLYFVSFATPSREQADVLTELGPATWAFFGAHVGWLLLWAALLLGVAWVIRRSWARLSADERGFVGVAGVSWLVAVGLGVVWGLAQAGPMLHFNGAFFVSIYALPLLLGASLLARQLPRRSPAPAALAYVLAAAWLGPRLALADLNPDVRGEPIRRAVDQALAEAEAARPKVLLFDAAQWSVAAAVALELQRRDVTWYTLPRWTFMFQDRHELHPLDAAGARAIEAWSIEATGDGAGFPAQSVTITRLPLPVAVGTVLESDRHLVHYALAGWEITAPHPAYSVAAHTWLVLRPEPSPGDVRIVFDAAANLRAEGGPAQQPAEIRFNGERIGTATATDRGPVSVVVPAEAWNAAAGATATLELVFPEAVPDHSFSRPRTRDTYAWTLWSIRFEPSP